MNRPIRLAVNTPIAQDPTSFYTGAGPLAELQKIMPLQLTFFDVNQDPNGLWPTLKLNDLVFMQRPCSQQHLNTVEIAKSLGIPVIISFDDDNLSVPKRNPQYHVYNQQQVKEAIVKMSRAADHIICTTENIRAKYSIYNQNITVVPNALDDFLVKVHRKPFTQPAHKMILWRGTMTNDENLKTIAPELIKLSHEHPEYKWVFFGYDPMDITEKMKNVILSGAPNAIVTYAGLRQIHAEVGYYALANNDHAQSRSHISWLEYTFAGMLSVMPKTQEFTRPGTLNFSSPEEFYTIMKSVLKGEIDIDKHVNESWECIKENYMLSKVNLLRKQIIEKVLGIGA